MDQWRKKGLDSQGLWRFIFSQKTSYILHLVCELEWGGMGWPLNSVVVSEHVDDVETCQICWDIGSDWGGGSDWNEIFQNIFFHQLHQNPFRDSGGRKNIEYISHWLVWHRIFHLKLDRPSVSVWPWTTHQKKYENYTERWKQEDRGYLQSNVVTFCR